MIVRPGGNRSHHERIRAGETAHIARENDNGISKSVFVNEEVVIMTTMRMTTIVTTAQTVKVSDACGILRDKMLRQSSLRKV